ncbi:hypothetical protein DPX16_6411 [Anabarilius grahami]|uniref:Uncharacterized protein n=1 Tax=Anabarilius grahami TaxID=495550 RepID=A0A3N0YMW8_ANAGA|nr:hypothetical protein DPX16_6411 [Anabarilius grahami]
MRADGERVLRAAFPETLITERDCALIHTAHTSRTDLRQPLGICPGLEECQRLQRRTGDAHRPLTSSPAH